MHKKIQRKCKNCGIMYYKTGLLFCSQSCHFLYKNPFKKCKFCKKVFRKRTPFHNSKYSIFCSHRCFGKSKRGKKHSIELIEKMRKAHMGNKSKLGLKISEETKKKISIANTKPDDELTYFSIHSWIRNHWGHPKMCKFCGKIGEKIKRNWNIQWANKKGSYTRNPKDWIPLCVKCHIIYDKK